MNPAEAAHGPGLIGAFLNVFLLGIMAAQVFYYFTQYKKDRPWIKAFVLFLLVADILNSIFDIYWLYTDIIVRFGDVENLGIADWRIETDPAMVAIVATCVQLFYAWRVKVLTGNPWITSLVVITAIVSCCGGLGVAIAIRFVKFYSDFNKFDQIGIVWLISTAVCDTTIALALTWHLRKHKTGFRHTDDVLNKIIRLTVQNGAITAFWAIVDLILFLAIPTGVHLAFNLPLEKLYTNSLMSSLNSRAGWKFNSAESDEQSTQPRGAGVGKSAAMPEFINLHTTVATTRPEVELTTVTRHDDIEADIGEQVMVTVESHEMTDIQDSDADTKWDQTQSRRRYSATDDKTSGIA